MVPAVVFEVAWLHAASLGLTDWRSMRSASGSSANGVIWRVDWVAGFSEHRCPLAQRRMASTGTSGALEMEQRRSVFGIDRPEQQAAIGRG